MKRVLLAAALVLVLVPTAALADTFLDFGILAGAAGTISYAGGSAPLVGSGITVSNITGVNTPGHPGTTLLLSNAVLNWTTGSSTGSWTWGGGSIPTPFITIVGGVPALNIPDGTLLLSGTFGSAQVIYLGSSFAKITAAAFSDVKDADLAFYFGLPASPYSGTLNLSFNTSGTPPNGFTSSSLGSGNVINTPDAVPEPGTLALFGTSLMGIIGLFRRKLNQSL